jgi:hypothetical protein
LYILKAGVIFLHYEVHRALISDHPLSQLAAEKPSRTQGARVVAMIRRQEKAIREQEEGSAAFVASRRRSQVIKQERFAEAAIRQMMVVVIK